jgi:DNA-binding response OmpR family regulator
MLIIAIQHEASEGLMEAIKKGRVRAIVTHPDPSLAKLLHFLLQEAGFETILLPDPETVLPAVVGQAPELVLLAVELLGQKGFTLCKLLRGHHYSAALICLLPQPSAAATLQAFAVGADEVIAEPFDPAEFLARVQAVRRRCQPSDHQSLGTLLQVGEAELALNELSFRVPEREPALLTPTELRVLECLMRNHGIIISRDTLIERVWGHDYVGDSNRLEVYIRRVRQKIEPDPEQPEYIQTVRGIGYVFRPPARQAVRASRPR